MERSRNLWDRIWFLVPLAGLALIALFATSAPPGYAKNLLLQGPIVSQPTGDGTPYEEPEAQPTPLQVQSSGSVGGTQDPINPDPKVGTVGDPNPGGKSMRPVPVVQTRFTRLFKLWALIRYGI